jgi:hypothetical protein
MVYRGAQMRKTLILAAFMLVVTACTTVGQASDSIVESPASATAAATEAPEALESATPTPVGSESPAPNVASVQESPAPAPEPASAAISAAEAVAGEPELVVPLAAPTSQSAELKGASPGIAAGNEVTLPFGFSGVVTLNAEITYEDETACPTGNTAQCRYLFTDSNVEPSVGWKRLHGTGSGGQIVFPVEYDAAFANTDDVKYYYLHFGYREDTGGGNWVDDYRSIEIILKRASET